MTVEQIPQITEINNTNILVWIEHLNRAARQPGTVPEHEIERIIAFLERETGPYFERISADNKPK